MHEEVENPSPMRAMVGSAREWRKKRNGVGRRAAGLPGHGRVVLSFVCLAGWRAASREPRLSSCVSLINERLKSRSAVTHAFRVA